MTINKANNGDQQQLSPRSVNARCFHFYDHMKQTRIPSILRRGNRKRFTTHSEATRDRLSPVNMTSDESSLESHSSPTLSSAAPCSPERILKIIMPDDLHLPSSVPSSFSPPSNKLRMKKANNEYREVSCSGHRNNVRFHSKVLVMRIPSRNQYPEHMKRNLWCSLSEIARSAQRNTIEFSSEGWDWRSAVEEESMYVHPKTGQYIHPAHVRRAASTTSPTPGAKADSEAQPAHE